MNFEQLAKTTLILAVFLSVAQCTATDEAAQTNESNLSGEVSTSLVPNDFSKGMTEAVKLPKP